MNITQLKNLPLFRPYGLHTPKSILGIRGFATVPPIDYLPPPPPKEFNEDGTPKRYRNSVPVFGHKYNWEHWTLRPAGVFHTVLVGEFGRQHKSFVAYLLQFPAYVAIIPSVLVLFTIAFVAQNIFLIGIKPKRYTIEWINAAKERELAENTNPVTRYLDRRRSERGPHWVLKNYLPSHPYFAHLGDYYNDPDVETPEQEV